MSLEVSARILQEQDLEVIREIQQLADVGNRFFVDGIIGFAAMAVFHDRHAGATKVGEFLLGDFQYFEGEGRRSGVEIE